MVKNLGYAVYDTWADGTQEFGQTRTNGNVFFEGDTIYSYGRHFPMARRFDWGFLINGDTYSVTTAGHQSTTRGAIARTNRQAVTIPFSTLYRADIQPKKIKVVDTEPDREIPTPCKRTRCLNEGDHVHYTHLLGRSIIEHNGDYYLSGTDETMVDAWRGYFLAQLPHDVSTVDEGVDALKPPEVVIAEAAGVAVKRQGEWFFIPTPSETRDLQTIGSGALLHRDRNRLGRHRVTELRSKGGGLYARGTVRHSANEHRMLKLGKVWHEVYENLEVRSFRSAGRID